MAKHIYGIDFGTSNSVLTILNKESNNIVNVHSENSLIYFQDAKNCFIGNEAVNRYISNNMSGRLLKSIKTLLPQSSFTFTYIYGKKYTAEDLVCLILRYLKDQADAFVNEEITEVVLGRPVVFSEDHEKDRMAEKRLLKAAQLAGFENIYFQYEPIAAGFLYEQTISKPELVLIGDFGGGTSDFTLMKLDASKSPEKNRREDILHTGGVHIGGDDFDSAIMWNRLVPYFGYGLLYDSYGKMLPLPVHIFRTLCEWDQMGFLKEGKIRKSLDQYYIYANRDISIKRLMDLIDHNLGYSLFREIEKTKVTISAQESSVINFQNRSIEISENISRNEFNEMVNEDVQKIDIFLDSFLKNAKVNPNQIDQVFLTGGTSCSPAVYNLFKQRFPTEKIKRGDNFNSVAQGLALSYHYLKI